MKLAIQECATLHFISRAAPITLHKDASDYPVLRCLFQAVDKLKV